MTEHPDHTLAYLDEPLAAFTDRLLNQPAAAASASTLSEDEDLRHLQETVQRLYVAFGPSQPDPAMARRILRHVRTAGEEKSPSLAERLRGIFAPEQKGWRSGPRAQRAQVFRYALATVAVVVLLMLIVPGAGAALTGSALGEGGWLPYAFLGVLLVIVGLWLWRNKPK